MTKIDDRCGKQRCVDHAGEHARHASAKLSATTENGSPSDPAKKLSGMGSYFLRERKRGNVVANTPGSGVLRFHEPLLTECKTTEEATPHVGLCPAGTQPPDPESARCALSAMTSIRRQEMGIRPRHRQSRSMPCTIDESCLLGGCSQLILQ